MGEMVGVTRALGDVEFFVVRLDSDHLRPSVLEALLRQVEAGTVRVLDVLLIRRPTPHEFGLIEVDSDEFALAGLELHARGLVAEDDVRHFAAVLPVATSALLILVEPTWAEQFSAELTFNGDTVLATQFIPAAVANAVLGSTRDLR
ncbi:DUF6325 family protein [Microbacterium phyllosphaerae]|uniref:DUF6325 family protein n=1 Tax=Microbacterium phyllosphaerae TaxID=124798 RepID=UPI003D654C0F